MTFTCFYIADLYKQKNQSHAKKLFYSRLEKPLEK